MYGYCLDDPINVTDKNGLWTADVGVGGSIAGFGFGVGGRGFIGIDDDLNFRYGFTSDPTASSGFGGGFEAGVNITTADKMDDLKGTAQSERINLGPAYVGTDHNKTYKSISAGVNLGPGKKITNKIEAATKLNKIKNLKDLKKAGRKFFIESGPATTTVHKFPKLF